MPGSQLFGTRRRTQVLILIALLGETFPTEAARLLGAPVYSVQTIVQGLAEQGVVAMRQAGRTRLVSLDPRYFAHRELRELLFRLAEAEPALQQASIGRRSRPRRAGKPL